MFDHKLQQTLASCVMIGNGFASTTVFFGLQWRRKYCIMAVHQGYWISTRKDTIHGRLQSQHQAVKVVYIDNCCQWRAKIQSVFGSHVQVLLDVFHAVQRVSKTISKRHPFHTRCLHDLRLAFRAPGDFYETCTKPTPQPDEIVKNLEMFVKWHDIKFNDQKVISDATLTEVENLKVHVRKGCLSNIKVGGGTNKNEAFHRYVNTFFIKVELVFCCHMH